MSVKKYTASTLIGTVLFLFVTWMFDNFSIAFFKDWKNFTLMIIISFAFSLIVSPFVMIMGKEWLDKTSKMSMKRRIYLTIVLFVVFFVLDIVIDKLLHIENSLAYYWGEAILILLLLIFLRYIEKQRIK